MAALQALDPSTHPQLHALVFGEGVVNDATAIVLLRAVQHIKSEAQLNAATGLAVMVNFLRLSGLSLLLGVGVGLASAFILKITFSEHHSTDREISLLAVLGFLSYLGAESSGLSGVFATFFCGLTMSHYAWHTLSPSAKVVSIYAFRVLSFLAELMLFLFCGLDLWSTSLWHKDLYTKAEIVGQTTMLSAWLIVGSPVTRAIVIGPLVFAVNLLRSPATKISTQDTLALIVAGCGRGAVTLALAMNHFVGAKGAGEEASVENQIIAVACMAAVVFSTVVLGGATPDIIAWLLARDVTAQWRQRIARFAARANGYSTLPSTDPRPSAPVGAGGGNAAGGGASTVPPQGRRVTAGASLVHDTWTKIDRNVLQPFFGGRTISRYRSPPPSPGRWRGAADAISVLQRSTPQPRERPPPPPNVLPSPFMIVEEGDFDASAALPPGEPAENDAEAKTVLEGALRYAKQLPWCPSCRTLPGHLLVLLLPAEVASLLC